MRIATALVLLASLGITLGQNCMLTVPQAPLTATGLATPYILSNVPGDPNSGMCDEGNANTGAFVQAAVIDLNSGAVSIYNPLVINVGTVPAINATLPTLPANNVVGIWFGFNGGKLILQNAAGTTSLTDGNCVNGFGGFLGSTNPGAFGEFAYCNAPAWFDAANNAILNGSLVVPALGTALDGQPCPTVRDFGVVDMDPSDNVLSQYLMVTNAAGVNQFAQDTPANRQTLSTTNFVANASDNRLVNLFIDAALGCTPWTALDLADTAGQNMVGALPLNELMAAQRQGFPQALVPENDPMVQVNGASSVDKINAYRLGVNQPTIMTTTQAPALDFCTKFAQATFTRIQNNMARLQAFASPDGNGNLYTFLVMNRFATAIGPAANGGLGCTTLGVANPFVAAAAQAGANTLLGSTNTMLVVVLAATGGALVLIGAGAAVFIFVQRRNAAATAANNFMAL